MTSLVDSGIVIKDKCVNVMVETTPSKNGNKSHTVENGALLSKNKSKAKNHGSLMSVNFLKNRSPGKSFMSGSHKSAHKSKGKKQMRNRLRSFEGSSRKNGLNKDKNDLLCSSEKLNVSSSQDKDSTEKISTWSWLGASTVKRVSTQGDDSMIKKVCYSAIQHITGDIVKVKDCVFVRSGTRKKDIPYIAKIYGLWEEGETKEMMMGVFWYYRREHIESETIASRYLDDEVFASRHRDVVPVACIEDKCFVLPFNNYCRFRAEVSRLESGAGKSLSSLIVPPLLSSPIHPSLPSALPAIGRPVMSSATIVDTDFPSCPPSATLSESLTLAFKSDIVSSTIAGTSDMESHEGMSEGGVLCTNLSTTNVASDTLDDTATDGVTVTMATDDINASSILVSGEITASDLGVTFATCTASVSEVVGASIVEDDVIGTLDTMEVQNQTRSPVPEVILCTTTSNIDATFSEVYLARPSAAVARLDGSVRSLRHLCSLALNAPLGSGHHCHYFNSQPITLSSSSPSGLITVFSTSTVASSGISLLCEMRQTEYDMEEERDEKNEFIAHHTPSPHAIPRLSDLALSVIGTSTPSPPVSSPSKLHSPGEVCPTTTTSSPSPTSIPEPLSLTPDVLHCYSSLTDYLAKEIDRDNVFLCRHIYDIKQRRISKNPHIVNVVPQTSQHGDVISPTAGESSMARS